jgi:CRP-like cAMP-binding protein
MLDSLQKFLDHYKIQTFEKNDTVLQQDVTPQCVYVVKQGVVGTYNVTSAGEERPIGFGMKGKFFPLGWLFGKTRKTQYYYKTLDKCDFYVVPKEKLLTFLGGSTQAMSQVLEQCVWELLNHEMRINALSQPRASDKVLRTIHYLSLCFGRDLKTDVVEIPLPLTRQEIANFTGLTRETVGGEIKKLEELGVLSSHRKKYVVHTDRLDALIDDEYEQQLVR